MPMIQKKIYELGRRLGDQGPRQDPTQSQSRGSGEKSTTVTKNRSSKNSLNLLQWNAEGLGTHKVLELRKLLKDKKVDAALIQETKLRNKLPPSFPGYEVYQCECKNTCQGILTLIRTDMQATVSRIKTNDNNDMHLIKLWKDGRKYTLYNVYSPPNVAFDAKLQGTNFKKTILAGDTNGHSPIWGYEDSNPSGKYIEETINSTNLILLQDKQSKATLYHRPSGKTFRPDHTLISADLDEQCHIEVLEDLGSDHLPIFIAIKTKKGEDKARREPRWNYSKADWNAFRHRTDDNISKIDLTVDINQQLTDFANAILQGAECSIPKGSRKKFSIIWSEKMEEAVNSRKKARKAAEKSPGDVTLRREYNRCSAKVKLISKELKRSSWEKTTGLLDLRKDGKKAWTLLDRLSGKNKRTNSVPLTSPTGGKVTTDAKKAETHNKFFSSIKNRRRKNLDSSIKSLTKRMEKRLGPFASIFTDCFTATELDQSLKKCKMKKAPGPDKVANDMLVQLSSYGKEYLLKLVNKTWKTGKLPEIWKTATVIPILKNGKPKEDPSSYRPISLTSCICKVAERMINARLYWWLENSHLLNPNQAGFRRGRQTIDQLIRLTQGVADGFQDGEHTAAVFVDLQQAYDHVWRPGLLFKMQKLGIQGSMYNWIKSFLQDRTIATKLNSSTSKKRSVIDGIPQGSALSCTLFLIFINDLPDCLNVQNAMFADDLVMWTTGTDTNKMQNRLNQSLSNLSTYCEFWKLKINCRKTVYTVFTLSTITAHTALYLKVQDQNIEKDENPCYLGIRLDPRLTFKTHIEDVSAKVTKRLNLLKRLGSTNWGSNKSTLRQLYTGYVRAVLDYSAPLQVTASNYNQKKLDRKQNEALRFVCGALRSTPTSACEIDANVEPLSIRRERSAALTLERFQRLEEDNPCKTMTTEWTPKRRIKKTSFLKKATEIASNHHFPEARETTQVITSNPPNTEWKLPKICKDLLEKADKSTPPPILRILAYETIESYPDSSIKAYTDGSAVNATRKGGYGGYLVPPYTTDTMSISGPCGEYCNNYDAEIVAIQKTLNTVYQRMEDSTMEPSDVVIFSDCLSSLEAIENWKNKPSKLIEKLLQMCHDVSSLYGIEITLQWIPAHCGIFGNEKADQLAKLGSRMPQMDEKTPYNTAKQIAKKHSKEVWYNSWIQNDTGRALFKYQPTPDPRDAIHQLERKDQCSIFRLRTGHAVLNMHRNRLDPQAPPHCRHCNYPYETVDHHLLHCGNLSELRRKLLPENPTIENCLYGHKEQLVKTAQYHKDAS